MALVRWFPSPPLPDIVEDLEFRSIAPVDVHRDDRGLHIDVALPGVTPDDVDVRVEQGRAIIDAERRQKQTHRGEGCVRHESFVGHVHREIAVPGNVDPGKVQARLEDGVLRLDMPLPEGAAPSRRIPVKEA